MKRDENMKSLEKRYKAQKERNEKAKKLAGDAPEGDGFKFYTGYDQLNIFPPRRAGYYQEPEYLGDEGKDK